VHALEFSWYVICALWLLVCLYWAVVNFEHELIEWTGWKWLEPLFTVLGIAVAMVCGMWIGDAYLKIFG
jgi:hypothetical protein